MKELMHNKNWKKNVSFSRIFDFCVFDEFKASKLSPHTLLYFRTCFFAYFLRTLGSIKMKFRSATYDKHFQHVFSSFMKTRN